MSKRNKNPDLPDLSHIVHPCLHSIRNYRHFLHEIVLTNQTKKTLRVIGDRIIGHSDVINYSSIITAIFLYTEEDTELVKYIKQQYRALDKLTGDWCRIFVLEKPYFTISSLRKFGLPILLAELYERCGLYRWFANTNPFDKNESYEIADKLGILPINFPCLVVLPPSNRLFSDKKLIIPIKEEVSKEYFRGLFSTLKNIVDHSPECGYYKVKLSFVKIIRYLERHSYKVSKKNVTEYQINGNKIFINKLRSIKVNENKPKINITESNVASVTGEGKIENATVHKHNYLPKNQNLADTVKKIQDLLVELSQANPNETTTQKMSIAMKAIQQIEQNASWKERSIKAFKAGSLEALKTNPIGAFVVGAIEDWADNKA